MYFLIFPTSSTHVQLSTSVSTATSAKRALLQDNNSAATRSSARKFFPDEYGKEAKRQHAARLKNTEQKTPDLKKRQCFRADLDPDVHISQPEAKVTLARENFFNGIGRLLPADQGRDCAIERERDHVAHAQTTHEQLVPVRAKFFAAADGFGGCGAVNECLRFHKYVAICGRFLVAKDAVKGCHGKPLKE